jgi:hypothetical protein
LLALVDALASVMLGGVGAFALATTSGAPTIDAAVFDGVLGRRTKTALTFTNVAHAECSVQSRARMFTAVARAVDEENNPGATFADVSRTTSFSYGRGSTRVACKVAQLQWNTAARFWSGDSESAYGASWLLKFRKVQLGGFDELQLVAYTPRGLYIYRHDLESGVSTTGKATAATGHDIVFGGPRNEASWEAVLDETLLPRLDSACERLAFVPFDDARLAAASAAHPPTVTENTYAGVPLSDCSVRSRGSKWPSGRARFAGRAWRAELPGRC